MSQLSTITDQGVQNRRPTNRLILLCVLVVSLNVVLVGALLYITNGEFILVARADPTATLVEYEPSNFIYEERNYDIHPGGEYIVYTNYACPYCAKLHRQLDGTSYTTRLLVLKDKSEGRFSTQYTVLAYMQQLASTNDELFCIMEQELFGHQDEWVELSSDEVLAWLNERSGLSITDEELSDERELLDVIEAEAPSDLEYVPSVYSDGRVHTGMVDALIEGTG